MKEKLLKVKEALEVLQQNFDAATYLTHRLPGDAEIITNANEALALLDSIISMLDSPRLVTKIVNAWDDSSFGDMEMYAKVAIESIME